MSADEQQVAKPKPWTVRHVDGWWCVYFSDDTLGAKFALRGDACTFADVAGPGDGTVIRKAELDSLRAELAETRRQLAIVYDAEWSRSDALAQRLRELESAGDALAEAAEVLDEGIAAASNDVPGMLAALVAASSAWRSVRGDAPAQPPVEGAPCAEIRGCDGECCERTPADAPAPTEPPAVGLPVTLSSVDDVAAVAWLRDVVAGTYPTWVDTVEHAPALLAAIEAARGGSR